jgi:hypothetical protein
MANPRPPRPSEETPPLPSQAPPAVPPPHLRPPLDKTGAWKTRLQPLAPCACGHDIVLHEIHASGQCDDCACAGFHQAAALPAAPGGEREEERRRPAERESGPGGGGRRESEKE